MLFHVSFQIPHVHLILPLVALTIHNRYVNVNEREKQEGAFSKWPEPSNMHDVDGVVCQLVCKSMGDGVIQLQQVC